MRHCKDTANWVNTMMIVVMIIHHFGPLITLPQQQWPTYSVAEFFHWLFQISFGLKTCYLPLTSIFRQSCDKHNIFRSAMIWNIETRSEQAGTELSWWTLMRHWKLSLLVWLMHELLAGFILYTRHCKLSQHYFAQIPLRNFFIGSFRSVLVWKLVITVDLYFLSVMRETQYFQKYWH